jgi:hypothetical protein
MVNRDIALILLGVGIGGFFSGWSFEPLGVLKLSFGYGLAVLRKCRSFPFVTQLTLMMSPCSRLVRHLAGESSHGSQRGCYNVALKPTRGVSSSRIIRAARRCICWKKANCPHRMDGDGAVASALLASPSWAGQNLTRTEALIAGHQTRARATIPRTRSSGDGAQRRELS